MAPKTPPPVIEITGSPVSGKTTVTRMLLSALEGKSILAIDAAADTNLAASFGLEAPLTLGSLIRKIDGQSFTRESIDWALQDLPLTLEDISEVELLVLGEFPELLSLKQKELLEYGLPRLFSHYDLVIIDDSAPALLQLLKGLDIRHLLIITPEDERYCQLAPYDKAGFILNKAGKSDAIPPSAVEHIQKGNWKLLGKLPSLSPEETRIQELPKYFEECINKLDLPLEIRSPFSL